MNKVAIILFSMFLVSCATGPTAKNKQESKIYVVGTKSLQLKEVSRWAKCKLPKKANQKDWKSWVDNINVCVSQKKWNQVESYSNQMLRRFPDAPWGLYFQSIVAEKKDNLMRSKWMIDRALTMTPEVGIFHFQKARLILLEGDKSLGRALMRRAYDLDSSLVEAAKFLAKAAYQDEDFKMSLQYLKNMDESELDESLLVVKMESLRSTKDYTLALEIAEDLSKKYTKNFNYGVRYAQLLEQFPEKRKMALQTYENLLKRAKKLGKSQKISVHLPDKISSLKRMIAKAEEEQKKKNEEKK